MKYTTDNKKITEVLDEIKELESLHMQVPMDAAGIALMAHEVLHAVSFILRKVGIEHTEETEEAYTYLHQYVMHQALKRVGRKHWK